MTSVGNALRAILAIVASQLAFLLNDALIKLASVALPMGEIVFLRGFFASLFIGAAIVATGLHRHIHIVIRKLVLWRSLGEVGGTFFYLIALFNMPIANATIIFQAVPLTATAGAALFLGEKVGWRRWLAIVIGFVGVVMVIRPGLDGFDAFGLFVLVSVLFVAFREIVTQAMPSATPGLLVALSGAIVVAAMGLGVGVTEDWKVPGWLHFLQLAGAGFLIAIGYFTAIDAMQLADMSLTAPFRYVAVVFAIAIGYLVWSDVPDAMTLLGSAVIVGAGLYTLYRESKVKGSGASLTAAPHALPPQT